MAGKESGRQGEFTTVLPTSCSTTAVLQLLYYSCCTSAGSILLLLTCAVDTAHPSAGLWSRQQAISAAQECPDLQVSRESQPGKPVVSTHPLAVQQCKDEDACRHDGQGQLHPKACKGIVAHCTGAVSQGIKVHWQVITRGSFAGHLQAAGQRCALP
jgi:hypothetical protein